MKIEMANVMREDASHHVTAWRIEHHVQILFGPKLGDGPLFTRTPEPWVWGLICGALDPRGKSP